MTWMNEAEIDEALWFFREEPEILPYVKYLAEWRDIVNNNSDGWPYWKAGAGAASKLMSLIQESLAVVRRQAGAVDMPTLKDFEKTLTSIKSFATKHKLPAPRAFGTSKKAEKSSEAEDLSAVMEVIHSALRNAQTDARINDVTTEGTEADPQVILTVDTGQDPYQVWVISKDGVRRSE